MRLGIDVGPFWISQSKSCSCRPELTAEQRLSVNRIWLGNTRDQGSALQLKDAQGRVRMMLLVSANGAPLIQMLDENGKISKTISPDSKE